MDTAAVMMNLDLIISADTAPLHLAGAWADRCGPFCRARDAGAGFQGRADSPWYPTMRLFRQNRPGDWTETFERVAAALSHLLV